MSVAATIALIAEVVAVAPQIAKTGKDVIDLVTNGYAALVDAFGDEDVPPEEIKALVAKIAANSGRIQAID